ncbi:MAG: class I SAM-dependent methyltransferase, partial [SAR324 cluster bacterium]|nr:class I SAM-dependent methyltransferase [SAR324 cluster bacterium]
ADDYRKYRAGFPPALLERLEGFGVGLSGQRLLDLGTGTGSLARQFAARGCTVAGLDPSEPMLEQARALDAEAGASVDYRLGRAEETGFPDESFDVVAAGQCWHWFDRPAAGAEAYRILRPGGKMVIAHFDWIRLPGNVVEATEEVITAFNPKWYPGRGAGIYPKWYADLSIAGFTALESFTFDEAAIYSNEAWRGRVRASAGVAASLSKEEVERFDRDLADVLRERFPQDPLSVPHRVFAIIGTRPA